MVLILVEEKQSIGDKKDSFKTGFHFGYRNM